MITGAGFERKSKASSNIPDSSLADMAFLLLIFFMVSTTFIKDTQLDLERPSAASGKKASTAALRVVLDQRGQIYVDDTPVKPWMVQTRVRQHLRESSEGAVLVVADRRVVAEKLIDVVDQCRLAGAADVGVVTDAEAG